MEIKEDIMILKLKLALLVFALLSSGLFGNNTEFPLNDNDSEIHELGEFIDTSGLNVGDIVHGVVNQFAQMLEFNRLNDEKGESDKNVYVLNYQEGVPFNPLTCSPTYVIKGAFVNNTWSFPWSQDFIDSICHFNSNDYLNNPNNIKKYAIFFGFPANGINSDLSNTIASQSAIIPYLRNTSADVNRKVFNAVSDTIFGRIKERINSTDVNNEVHRLVTISGYYRYKKPYVKETFQQTTTRTFYWQDDVLTGNVFNGYLQKCNQVTGPSSTEKYTGEMYKRLKGFLEFFNDPENLGVNYACNLIPATTVLGAGFRDCVCTAYPNITEPQKEFLLALVNFIDNNNSITNHPYIGTILGLTFNPVYGALIDGAMVSNVCDPGNWFRDIFEDFKTFTEIAGNENAYYLDYIINNKLNGSTVSEQDLVFWFAKANLPDFHNLSTTQRVKMIKDLRAVYPDGCKHIYVDMVGEVTTVSMTAMVSELIYTVENNGEGAANDFLNGLKTTSGLLKWLFEEAVDDLFVSVSSEHRVIKAFCKIATFAKGGPSAVIANTESYYGKGLIWQPNPWYWNFDGQYNYRKYSTNNYYVNSSGLVSFETKLTNSYLNGGLHVEPYILLDPFELIPVLKGTNYSWKTDGNLLGGIICEDQGLLCNKAIYLPAFAVAWYFEKLNDDQVFDGVMTALEVASMFVGVGQLNALYKVTSGVNTALKIRRVAAGLTVAADIADIVLPNTAAFAMEQFGMDPAEALIWRDKIKGITGVAAIAGGVTQVADLIVGISKARSLSKAIGQSSTGVDEFADDVKRYLNLYPDLSNQLNDAIGLSQGARTFVNGLSHERKIIVLGEIIDLGNDNIKNSAKLVEFLDKTLDNQDLAQAYMRISDKSKLFQNILDGAMDADFAANPGLLRAYMAVHDEISTTTAFLKDKNTILKIFEKFESPTLITRLGSAEIVETEIRRMIKRNSWLRCDACGTGGIAHYSKMPDFLDEAEHFVLNFDITPNGDGRKFYNWMRGLNNNGTQMAPGPLPIEDEVHQTIHFLRNQNWNATDHVEALGEALPNGKYTDLTMRPSARPPKYRELKSYKEGSNLNDDNNVLSGLYASPLKNRTSFRGQFIDGYVPGWNNLADLEYVFEARKLQAGGEALVKDQFAELITTYRTQIFNNMTTTLRTELNITMATDIDAGVANQIVDAIITAQ